MKIKITYKVNGKVFPAYHQTEKNAFESMMVKLKYGWSVLAVEQLSW